MSSLFPQRSSLDLSIHMILPAQRIGNVRLWEQRIVRKLVSYSLFTHPQTHQINQSSSILWLWTSSQTSACLLWQFSEFLKSAKWCRRTIWVRKPRGYFVLVVWLPCKLKLRGRGQYYNIAKFGTMLYQVWYRVPDWLISSRSQINQSVTWYHTCYNIIPNFAML